MHRAVIAQRALSEVLPIPLVLPVVPAAGRAVVAALHDMLREDREVKVG